MPSQVWLDADEDFRAAEAIYQPIKADYHDRIVSYDELVAARELRDIAVDAWHDARCCRLCDSCAGAGHAQ